MKWTYYCKRLICKIIIKIIVYIIVSLCRSLHLCVSPINVKYSCYYLYWNFRLFFQFYLFYSNFITWFLLLFLKIRFNYFQTWKGDLCVHKFIQQFQKWICILLFIKIILNFVFWNSKINLKIKIFVYNKESILWSVPKIHRKISCPKKFI